MKEVISGFINKAGKIFEFEKKECPVTEQVCRNIVNEELVPIREEIEELSQASRVKSFSVTEFPENPSLGDTYQYWGDNPNYEKGQVYKFSRAILEYGTFILYWAPKFKLND
jgi:hypothetical protein